MYGIYIFTYFTYIYLEKGKYANVGTVNLPHMEGMGIDT